MDEDDDDEEDENTQSGDGNYIYDRRLLNNTFNIINTTWENNDLPKYNNSNSWINDFSTNDFADFADFDAHFSSFHNDLGDDYITPTTSITAIKSLPLNPRMQETSNMNLTSLINISNETLEKENQESTITAPLHKTYSEPLTNLFNRNHEMIDENNGFANTNALEEYDNNANVGRSSWITPFHLNPGGNVVTLAKFVSECDKSDNLWPNITGDSNTMEPIVETNSQTPQDTASTALTEMVTDHVTLDAVITNGPTAYNTENSDEINNDSNNEEPAVSNATPLEL